MEMLHLSRGLADTNRNNRPRYAFVRTNNVLTRERVISQYGEEFKNANSYNTDRTPVEHALYDIVDNIEGGEQVLAYCVRYTPAVLIVGALNAQEEGTAR
jgi:hypothetical protein